VAYPSESIILKAFCIKFSAPRWLRPELMKGGRRSFQQSHTYVCAGSKLSGTAKKTKSLPVEDANLSQNRGGIENFLQLGPAAYLGGLGIVGAGPGGPDPVVEL